MATGLPPRGAFALVTGATAGIGAEFARQLAARGYHLVLVARNEQRLRDSAAALAGEFGVSTEVLAADLLATEGILAVEERLRSAQERIGILVNNAGYGLRKPFDENPVGDELDHLRILVEVPLRLTHAALEQMLPAAAGTIVNIASVAGFTPRGTYGAAKAWVISFSRWAHLYYGGRGISVTAVAPGFVRTEFHERMEVSTTSVPDIMWLKAEVLVRKALRDVERNRAVSVPTVRYKLVVWLSGWLPKRIVAAGALRGR
jgi:short-subunit dehydrogenase